MAPCSSIALSYCLFFFLLISCTLPPYAGGSGAFNVSLMHADTPKSRSISRTHRLAKDCNGSRSLAFELFPTTYLYLMPLAIGTPPFNMHAVIDTGSDLIWTQCSPCDACYKQNDALFDPTKSSTYQEIPCNSDSCNRLFRGLCVANSTCKYDYKYGDGSYSRGFLTLETISFGSEGKDRVSIPGITMGCTHASNGTFDSRSSGFVGLGRGPLSLVSQLGSAINNKFSYCLVPHQEVTSSGMLHFGDSAVLRGKNVATTPLLSGIHKTFYYLQLTEVIVKNMAILVKSLKNGNMIIDSGTTLSVFNECVINNLEHALEEVIDLPRTQDPAKLFDLCYETAEGAEEKLPDITLRFNGQADMVLSPLNTFWETSDGVMCLSFVTALPHEQPILGNHAQQNFLIEYDLGEQKLSFAPTECAKL